MTIIFAVQQGSEAALLVDCRVSYGDPCSPDPTSYTLENKFFFHHYAYEGEFSGIVAAYTHGKINISDMTNFTDATVYKHNLGYILTSPEIVSCSGKSGLFDLKPGIIDDLEKRIHKLGGGTDISPGLLNNPQKQGTELNDMHCLYAAARAIALTRGNISASIIRYSIGRPIELLLIDNGSVRIVKDEIIALGSGSVYVNSDLNQMQSRYPTMDEKLILCFHHMTNLLLYKNGEFKGYNLIRVSAENQLEEPIFRMATDRAADSIPAPLSIGRFRFSTVKYEGLCQEYMASSI